MLLLEICRGQYCYGQSRGRYPHSLNYDKIATVVLLKRNAGGRHGADKCILDSYVTPTLELFYC